MANKIIKIGNVTNKISLIEPVYNDINMVSQDKVSCNNDYGYNYKINRLVDVRAVQNALRNIFSWIPGERVINPEFGSNLRMLLYEGITEQNEKLIVAEIKQSVSKWEPRVTITKVTNISTIQDTEDNTIILDVEYYIDGLSDKLYNLQYSYTKQE